MFSYSFITISPYFTQKHFVNYSENASKQTFKYRTPRKGNNNVTQ